MGCSLSLTRIANSNMTPPLQLYIHFFNFRFRHRDRGMDVHGFIDAAAALGFSGINIWIKHPPLFGGYDAAYLDGVRRHLESCGLGIDAEMNGTDPDELAAMLEIARRLGAEHLRTYTLRRPDAREQVESAVRDLKLAAPLAEKAGVTLLVENHEDLTATQVAEILDRVDHPRVRALFDYGNSAVFMEEPAVSAAVLGRYVRTAHLKDHVAIPAGVAGNGEPLWMGVPLGEGNLPIMETTRTLQAAGVKRISFENCWAYSTPFRARRGAGRLGEGVFAYRHPPYDPMICLPDTEGAAATRGLDLAEMEQITMHASVRWLERTLAREGITLTRPLRPPEPGE